MTVHFRLRVISLNEKIPDVFFDENGHAAYNSSSVGRGVKNSTTVRASDQKIERNYMRRSPFITNKLWRIAADQK